jgi:hypothetical protein
MMRSPFMQTHGGNINNILNFQRDYEDKAYRLE